MTPLEKELQTSMLALYERWKAYGRPKNYFLQMVKKTRNTSRYKGPAATVRYLLDRDVSTGFKSLLEAGRLDLTIEALILEPKWADLFSEWDLKRAKVRIDNASALR